jgi:RND family efflux transporter MFP subunit
MTESPKNLRRDLSALRIPREERVAAPSRVPWLLGGILVGAIAIIALLVLIARGSGFTAPRVRTGTALLERAPTGAESLLTASGYVVARRKASVSARRAGRLVELRVEEGSRVKKDEILARIEASDLEAQLRTLGSEAEEAHARLANAEAQRDVSRTEHDRAQRLHAAGVGAKTDEDLAVDRLTAAEAAVAEARAAEASARSRVAGAQVDLEYSLVRAPFDGLVLRKEAEVGESVAPAIAAGQTTRGAIVTMADLASLEVEVDVSESRIGLVKEGMPAEIAVDAIPDTRFRGLVRQIIPTADRQKATVQVKVTFVDQDDRVRPEMGAKATFLSAEPDAKALAAPPVVTLPASAVRTKGGSAVFVLDAGHVRRVAVTLGERRGDRVVALSGLSGGETLVLDPPASLDDGAAVKKEES